MITNSHNMQLKLIKRNNWNYDILRKVNCKSSIKPDKNRGFKIEKETGDGIQ